MEVDGSFHAPAILPQGYFIFMYISSALDWGEWLPSRSGRFTSEEEAPGTCWIEGRLGPRACLEVRLSGP
jgi:hypothetical protein